LIPSGLQPGELAVEDGGFLLENRISEVF